MSDQYYKVFLYGSVNATGGRYDHPVEIMDNSIRDMVLINPKVYLAADEAGSFDFTMPKNHIFYDAIIPYGSTIAVKEDDSIIFIGRPLPPTIDTWGQKTFHCEGALAFLNDVVLYYQEAVNPITAEEYFDNTLTYYNMIAGRPDRQFLFSFANPEFQEAMIYDPDPWDYQTVLEFIRSYLHQFVSGHFYVQYIDFDELELKWFRDFDDGIYYDIPGNNQPVQSVINLTDIEQIGCEFYTAAIAKGGEDSDGNVPYMTEPVIHETMAEKYGVICKKLEYPDIKVKDALEAMCDSFVHGMQFETFSFKVSAADQHPLDSRFDQYKILQKVRVNAEQFGVSVVLPISRMEISLVSAVKYINVGLIDTVPLTISIEKNLEEESQEAKETAKEEAKKVKQDGNDSLVIRGKDGNDYEVSVDEGGNLIATKIPRSISISPSSATYRVGQSFDLSAFTVTAHYANDETSDVTYACTYNMESGYVFVENDFHKHLVAMYNAGGKNLTATAKLTVEGIMPKTGEIKINGNTFYLSDWADYTASSYYGCTFKSMDGKTVVFMDWKLLAAHPERDADFQVTRTVAFASGGRNPYCRAISDRKYIPPDILYGAESFEWSEDGVAKKENRTPISHRSATVEYNGNTATIEYMHFSYYYTDRELYPDIDLWAFLIASLYFYEGYGNQSQGSNDSGNSESGDNSESGGGGHF